MPYGIKRVGNKWLTYNRRTGATKGTHATRAKAEAQRRLLEGLKHSPERVRANK